MLKLLPNEKKIPEIKPNLENEEISLGRSDLRNPYEFETPEILRSKETSNMMS